MALLVMEPRRGKAALDEIEGLALRLQKFHAERPIKKILVGTKLDDAAAPEDRAAIERFVRDHGLDGYVATSARAGSGIDDLRRAIAYAIDWESSARPASSSCFTGSAVRSRLRSPPAASSCRCRSSTRSSAPATPPGTIPRRCAPASATSPGKASSSILASPTDTGSGAQIEHLTRYAGSLILMARRTLAGSPPSI